MNDAMRRIILWLKARKARQMRKRLVLHGNTFHTYESVERAIRYIETGEFEPRKNDLKLPTYETTL